MTSINYLIKEISAVLGAIKTEPMQDLLLVDAINKAKEMHKDEQENLYTEEQVREAISKSVSILVGQEINLAQLKELIIKSLKQPKQ